MQQAKNKPTEVTKDDTKESLTWLHQTCKWSTWNKLAQNTLTNRWKDDKMAAWSRKHLPCYKNVVEPLKKCEKSENKSGLPRDAAENQITMRIE